MKLEDKFDIVTGAVSTSIVWGLIAHFTSPLIALLVCTILLTAIVVVLFSFIF